MSEDIPGWLKKVLKDRGRKVEEAARRAIGPDAAVDWPKKLGCGHYGCAWGILEPGLSAPRYVVKVTRDPTEGPMQAKIAERQQRGDYGFDDGFAIVRGVYRLEPDVEWRGKTWPVYAVVREEVLPVLSAAGKGVMLYGYMSAEQREEAVPGIYPPVKRWQLGKAIDALHKYKDAAAKWYAQGALKRPSQHKLDQLDTEMSEHLSRISDFLPTVGTIMGILQSEGTPLRDVHANNIGVRRHPGVAMPDDPEAGLGYVVIFDPGHLPQGDETAERGITRINPVGPLPRGEVIVEAGGKNITVMYVDKAEDMVFGVMTSNKKKDGNFYVGSLEVAEEWQRRGIATLLYEKTIEEVRKRGVKLISELESRSDDANALHDSALRKKFKPDTWETKGHEVVADVYSNPAGFTYSLPEEHLSASANPHEGFIDAFGIPAEAHLAPVWPEDRKEYKRKILGPEGIASYLHGAGDIPQEQFMVALLDQRGALMGIVVISKGTLGETPVHPREVFAAAVAARAAGIIGIHNHPSGNTTPSAADVETSHRLSEAADIVGIPFMDHIVLGRGGKFTSLAAAGQLRDINKPRRNPTIDAFDFADDFGQPAEPAKPEAPGRLHLDTLKRGDVVRVGKTKWHVFNAKHGAWVVKYGTSGEKMYEIRAGEGGRFVVHQMTGSGEWVGDPVAEGDAEVVGWEERA